MIFGLDWIERISQCLPHFRDFRSLIVVVMGGKTVRWDDEAGRREDDGRNEMECCEKQAGHDSLQQSEEKMRLFGAADAVSADVLVSSRRAGGEGKMGGLCGGHLEDLDVKRGMFPGRCKDLWEPLSLEGKGEAFATSLGVWLVYWLTLSRTITGGDSGEVLAAACSWAPAHPPGYRECQNCVSSFKICS